MSTCILLVFIQILLIIVGYHSEKIRYIATEQPGVDGINTKYVSYINLTSRRYGRKDPFYYVGLNMDWIHEFHNNVSGPYSLSNMTIPIKHIPANFPFKKGRIYCNITRTANSEIIAWGQINMEIKEIHTNVRNWVDKQ